VTEILTPRFLQTAFGVDAPDAAGRAAALSTLDLGPVRIESIGPVSLWSDGRGAVEVFYQRGHGHPEQAVAARWFLIAARGVVRFDEEALLSPPSLGDQVTIGFSIADDRQPLRWDSPDSGQIPLTPVTALHGANRGRNPHAFLLTNPAGATVGILALPPWSQGDLVLLDLPAGTYRLVDLAVAGSEIMLEVVSRES
jgi:hypothetical protein